MSRPVALFRVAAGPRLGHGHLRRAETLAALLSARALVSLRGTATATALEVVPAGAAGPTLDTVRPTLLVLDDPHPVHARRWCLAAQRRSIPVVSVHDLGLARVPSTLAVDGSIASPTRGWRAAQVCRGVAFAIIRPPFRRRLRVRTRARRVLVSLGGGPRRAFALQLARELRRRHPDVEVLLPSPVPSRAAHVAGGIRQVAATRGLGAVFPGVDLAILGGGVTLYEAAAAGVPAVSVEVVPAQRPTIAAFARAGVIRYGGALTGARGARVRAIVDAVSASLDDVTWRREAARKGRRLVDGRGARRVARTIESLLQWSRRD